MQLNKQLTQFGLDEKEAKVYLAALEMGVINIQGLVKKSGIKRSTVYEMIKNLKEKGLMSVTTKGARKLYVATSPENIKRMLSEKQQLFKDIMPELMAISNIGFDKPKIKFYEGIEGLREIYWDALNIKSKMAYWISPIQSIFDTVGKEFLEKYVEIKAKKGLWIKSIHIVPQVSSEYKYGTPETFEKTLRLVRYAPPEINIKNTIGIYDDKVAVISTRKEGFGFVVESKDYANSMKIFYDLLWNISKPYGDADLNKKREGNANIAK